MNDFLDIPKAGGGSPGSGNRPSNGASDFLQNRPAQPSQRPNERPGAGERPRPSDSSASENRPDRIDDRQGNRNDRQDSVSGNRNDRQDSVSGNRDDRQDSVSGNRDDRKDSVSDRREGQVDNRQDRQENLTDNRADRIDNVGQRQTDRVDRRDEVRDQVRHHPPHDNFWAGNRYAGRWNQPYRWATWGAVSTWLPWGWSQPSGYSYGENVYVQDESVYYGDELVGTQQEYGEQAYAIASRAEEVAPDESADDSQWMSLGVFAMTQDGQASGPEPKLFLQLAVSKEGMIAGTYNNNSTDKSHDIEGVIDKETQRTAWTVGGKDWPVMETGISNLTKDEAPALVHFEDGQTQQWLLVRLEDPDATGK